MRSTLLWAGIVVSLPICLGGCEAGAQLENPDQPKTLGAPWVNKMDTEFGSSMTSSDAAGNRVFSVKSSTFGGLIEHIVSEYNTPVAIRPKAMSDWNLTTEVKGKNQEEVLQDVAAKCKLTLDKNAAGQPRLTRPGEEAGEEFLVKIEEGEREMETEE